MPPCPNCGKEAPAEATFCPFCGKNLPRSNAPLTPTGSYQPPYALPPGMMEDRMERLLKRLERVTYLVAAEAIVLFIILILTFIPIP